MHSLSHDQPASWESRGGSGRHLHTSAYVLFSGETGRRFWAAARELRLQARSIRRKARFHQTSGPVRASRNYDSSVSRAGGMWTENGCGRTGSLRGVVAVDPDCWLLERLAAQAAQAAFRELRLRAADTDSAGVCGPCQGLSRWNAVL